MAILVITYDTATGGFRTQKIGSAQISGGAIVSAKIGVLAVGGPHIAANAITSGKVASGGLSPLSSGKVWAGYTGNMPREENKPAAVPSGVIAMWHGTIANIPAGWVICDGNNSTPNLLTRFVQGVATAATDPGATGGATAKTTAGHIHTMGTHKHTMPSHSHNVTVPQHLGFELGGTLNMAEKGTYETTSVDPGDTNTKDPGDTNSNTDSIADIRPLFYDIAYLMKT